MALKLEQRELRNGHVERRGSGGAQEKDRSCIDAKVWLALLVLAVVADVATDLLHLERIYVEPEAMHFGLLDKEMLALMFAGGSVNAVIAGDLGGGEAVRAL